MEREEEPEPLTLFLAADDDEVALERERGSINVRVGICHYAYYMIMGPNN